MLALLINPPATDTNRNPYWPNCRWATVPALASTTNSAANFTTRLSDTGDDSFIGPTGVPERSRLA